MIDIKINFFNYSFCKIVCSFELAKEIQDNFSFRIDNYRFNPKVKKGLWDGYIKLLNLSNKNFPVGLIDELILFCKNRNYTFELAAEYKSEIQDKYQLLSNIKNTSDLPENFIPKDYQLKYVVSNILLNRNIILSPTGSGKSFMIYLILRHYLDKIKKNDKVLIIVPVGGLVLQLFSDFKTYGFDSDSFIHLIVDGNEKDSDKQIVISTWQALQHKAILSKNKNLSLLYDPKWFSQFKVLFGDECHHFQANALKAIADCCINAKYRIGTSGTLDESKTNEMILKGIFGSIREFVTTKDLIDSGDLASLNITSICLKYSDEIKKLFKKKKPTYEQERDLIINDLDRNEFITNLALNIKGNTLIIYRFDSQGKILYDLIVDKAKQQNRNVYKYSGSVTIKEREEIRNIIENEKDAIIIGTIGTISTGINIVMLKNLIFASPSKGRIKVMQSIGRALRISEEKNKTKANLYDIGDDISLGNYKNYLYKHFLIRLELYIKQKLDYKYIEKGWK